MIGTTSVHEPRTINAMSISSLRLTRMNMGYELKALDAMNNLRL